MTIKSVRGYGIRLDSLLRLRPRKDNMTGNRTTGKTGMHRKPTGSPGPAWTGLLPTPVLRSGVLVLLLALVGTGCTTGPREWLRNGLKVGPNYARPSAPVAGDWIDAGNPILESQAADYSHWWTVFDDPVMDHLVHAAYEQNLPLKIAGMRILEARAQLGVVKGNLFPQVQEMTGGFARSELSQSSFPFGEIPLAKTTFDTWSGGFDAAWELDFWGRFRRAVESADANLDAQVENYDDALVILQAEVAATYVQVRTLEERIALARKNVELQKSTLQLSQDRFEQGMVSKLDVKQAQSILAATESLIPILQAARRVAQNRLCTLMGLPPCDLEVELGDSGEIPKAPPEVAVGIPAELLRRRPDVRRAERETAAQCARIGVAESELYPHFAISGNIALEAEFINQLFDPKSIAASAGPSFRWNILNYGRIRNMIRVEDARFGQLVLKYRETVLRANREVEDSISNYLREQLSVKRLEEATQATAEAAEIAKLQYAQGLTDFQRVIDSERALVRQQDALAESQGNVALNLIAVYKGLGGGWQMRLQPNQTAETADTESPFEEEQETVAGNEPPTPAELIPTPLPAGPTPDAAKSSCTDFGSKQLRPA